MIGFFILNYLQKKYLDLRWLTYTKLNISISNNSDYIIFFSTEDL